MIKKLITTLLLSSCVLLCASPAHSEEAELSPEEAEQTKQARALFDEGSAALQAGDYEKAHDAFERSFNIRASFDTAANLGQAEMMQGMYVLAARHLEYSLRNFPTGENRELKKGVSKLFAQVQPKVVTIHAKVSPPGARVTFGDDDLGEAPIAHPLFAKPNVRYLLTAQGTDGVKRSVDILGEAGETKNVELDLEEGKNFPSVSSGLESPGAGSEPNSRKRNWVPAYILGGVSVASFATSMVFRGLAGSQAKKVDQLESDLDGACVDGSSSRCTELETAADRHDGLGRVSNVTLIASGAVAAATVGYVIYTLAKKPRTQRVSTSVDLNRNGGSLMFSGHF